MANKRSLKKQVRYVCGDLAAECAIAIHVIPGIDKAKMNEVICDIARLQTVTLANATFAFDKTPAEFPSRHEYAKAHAKYCREAYHALKAQFNQHVGEIVKAMNATLPGRTPAAQ